MERPAPEMDQFELRGSTNRIGSLSPGRFLTWLGPVPQRPGVVAWPVILLPDFVAGTGTMAPDSVELYQRVDWNGPVPLGDLVARVSPRWARLRKDRIEYGLSTEVIAEDRPVASSVIVCLTRSKVEPFGRSVLARPPDPGTLERGRQLTIGDQDVREYSEAVRSSYLVTSRATIAHEMGYRNILVPGPMLTAAHLAAEPSLPDAGSVEVWFRRPVTAGSAMVMCSAAGSGTRCFRPIGANEPATISRLGPLPGGEVGDHGPET